MATTKKKKLQDYIHLYVGCDCKFKDEGGYEGIGKLTGNILNGIDMSVCEALPILRPLSDMTKEELHFINMSKLELNHAISQKTNASFYTTEFIYFLSKGFDLFNLIEEGLAIDKTTLK